MSAIELIPIMSSNTQPYGEAIASSILNGNFDAYMAFNGIKANLSTMQGGWLASSSDIEPTLSYTFDDTYRLDQIFIETANNSTTLTVVCYVEGYADGAWENCLDSGDYVELTFTNGTYREYNIALNEEIYEKIRIRGNETWYKGISATACTISRMQVYGETPPVGPGFNVILQVNNSELNKMNKNIDTLATFTGTLKQPTSLIDPVFIFECNIEDFALCNYLTVEKFRRSYFINSIKSIRNYLVEVSCHVDVISTYAEYIRECVGIIKKQENEWNLYLNDGSLKVYQNPNILTKAFPSGFTTQEFVLAVAGS